MTLEDIKTFKNTLLRGADFFNPKYKIERTITGGERIRDFHEMADGKRYEGAFLIRNEYGDAYWLVLINWNIGIGHYIIVYPEKRTGPMIEIHRLEHNGFKKNLDWRYKPSKRDGKNDLRKKAFEKYSLDLNVLISFPETPSEMPEFLNELFSLAEARLKADNLNPTEIIEPREGFPEGKRIERLHYSRERNPKVVKLAKASFKEKNGRLFCEICGFDFQKVYGHVGEDFIEAHHTLPLGDLENEQVQTKIEDIAMLCSNCHKMIHRKRPWLEMDAIKGLVSKT